jgi:hypothetical protein
MAKAKGPLKETPVACPDLPVTTVSTSGPPVSQARNEEITLKTAGQRRINFIWEVTQSIIALLSVGAGIFIMIFQAIYSETPHDLPSTLSSMIFLVLGFYFARTNHDKTGGVGDKGNNNRGD